MNKLFLIILWLFDFFHKLKIIKFLKKKLKFINTFVDVGAHRGESVRLFSKNFKILNIYSFEPSLDNYNIFLKKINNFVKKKKINFKAFNVGLGKCNQELYLNIPIESSSATINFVNKNSNYFIKKNKFLGSNQKDFFYRKELIKVITLDSCLKKEKLNLIDLIKIDTEGFEYEILQGSQDVLKITRLILFEHHYDNMLLKNYKFNHIHNFLIKNNFAKVFKAKMPLRKTFDYIYENKKI